MSKTDDRHDGAEDEDPWERVARYRETLEMVATEDVPFSDRAQYLLDRLDEEGY